MADLSKRALWGCCFFLVTSLSAYGAEIAFVPVRATGDHEIVGNEIRLRGAGQRITLDIFIGDWDPDGDGMPRLRAYEVVVDSTGYTSGLAGALTPPLVACETDDDCVAAFQGACSFSGDSCQTDAECEFAPFGELCEGSACEFPVKVGGFCEPGFFMQERPDFIFGDAGVVGGVNLTSLDYRWGATTLSEAVVDQGEPKYAGTLMLDASPQAKGTFVVDFKVTGDAQGSSLLDDAIPTGLILPLSTTPAKITILCQEDGDCDDGDPCTLDQCVDEVCANERDFDENQSCCDAETGFLCKSIPEGLVGDFDGDGAVTVKDFALLMLCFGTDPSEPACERVETVCDCRVDHLDVAGFIPLLEGPPVP